MKSIGKYNFLFLSSRLCIKGSYGYSSYMSSREWSSDDDVVIDVDGILRMQCSRYGDV